MNCYPQYWTPPSATGPVLDWFNTYQVTMVTMNDLVAPIGWYDRRSPPTSTLDRPGTATIRR